MDRRPVGCHGTHPVTEIGARLLLGIRPNKGTERGDERRALHNPALHV